VAWALKGLYLKKLRGEEVIADVAGSEGEPATGVPLLGLLTADLTVLHHLQKYSNGN
jgi:hypothetical protein